MSSVPVFFNGLAITGNNGSASSAFDAGNDVNRCLIVAVLFTAATDPGISVTYAGEALAAFGGRARHGDLAVSLFFKFNPAAGSNTLSVSGAGGGVGVFALTSVWSGVDPFAPITGVTSADTAGATPTNNITSLRNDSLDIEAIGVTSTTCNVASGQTLRVQYDVGPGADQVRLSEKRGTGGVDGLAWSCDVAESGVWAGFSLNPAPPLGGVGMTPFLTH